MLKSDNKVSVSNLFSNSKDVQMLGAICKLLTNEKVIFIKYKIVGDLVFGICLQLKVRLDFNVFTWYRFTQVICSHAKIDFQGLELMKHGISFTNSNWKDAMVKCNLFLTIFKDFCASNLIVVDPQNVVEIQTKNGAYTKFPVNIEAILTYKCN